MLSVMTTVLVTNPGSPEPIAKTVLVSCFGLDAVPLPPVDLEREMLIQAEGLTSNALMSRCVRTGDAAARDAAVEHTARMTELIKGRSARACAWFAEQRGLPHA